MDSRTPTPECGLSGIAAERFPRSTLSIPVFAPLDRPQTRSTRRFPSARSFTGHTPFARSAPSAHRRLARTAEQPATGSTRTRLPLQIPVIPQLAPNGHLERHRRRAAELATDDPQIVGALSARHAQRGLRQRDKRQESAYLGSRHDQGARALDCVRHFELNVLPFHTAMNHGHRRQ